MEDQFPMPTPTVPVKPLTAFKSLSFDIYETLIQWDDSVLRNLMALLKRAPTDSQYRIADTDQDTRNKLWELFHKHEFNLEAETPDMRYDKILTQGYLRLAADLGVPLGDELKSAAHAFGEGAGDWPAYPDTVGAMKRLGKYYKLIALSNVDNYTFDRTNAGPLEGIKFWRIYSAQEIGSFKPDLKNFEYLLEHIDEADRSEGGEGIAKEQNLHVAQSLYHDHRPARKMGLSSVWINRKDPGARSAADWKKWHDDGEVGYGWRFGSLGEFADEVERQWEK